MRPTENRFNNPEIQVLFKTFAAVLANVSSDNFRAVELTGTTNATADTASRFKHNLGKIPAFWFPLEGRVYVPRNGFSDTELDLRSTESSEAFRILVVA
jgi:plasmid maintenance system antidote protein VapI